MKRRKAIASLGAGAHGRLLELAARSFRPFARRHGYALHLYTEAPDQTRPLSWSRIPILLELLEQYETVVWIDSDAVIVDPRDDLPPIDFMALVRHETSEGSVPNAGVWALHRSARPFLRLVWEQDDLVEHPWWENAAVMRLLGYRLERPVRVVEETPWLERTAFLDPSWNSIPQAPASEPRINHYPGHDNTTRERLMRHDLNTRKRVPPWPRHDRTPGRRGHPW